MQSGRRRVAFALCCVTGHVQLEMTTSQEQLVSRIMKQCEARVNKMDDKTMALWAFRFGTLMQMRARTWELRQGCKISRQHGDMYVMKRAQKKLRHGKDRRKQLERVARVIKLAVRLNWITADGYNNFVRGRGPLLAAVS